MKTITEWAIYVEAQLAKLQALGLTADQAKAKLDMAVAHRTLSTKEAIQNEVDRVARGG